MKIADARVIVCSPGRNFGTLKVVAEGGLHGPGLGVDIDEKLAAKFPCQRAYLPVNRKLDGTLHDW